MADAVTAAGKRAAALAQIAADRGAGGSLTSALEAALRRPARTSFSARRCDSVGTAACLPQRGSARSSVAAGRTNPGRQTPALRSASAEKKSPPSIAVARSLKESGGRGRSGASVGAEHGSWRRRVGSTPNHNHARACSGSRQTQSRASAASACQAPSSADGTCSTVRAPGATSGTQSMAACATRCKNAARACAQATWSTANRSASTTRIAAAAPAAGAAAPAAAAAAPARPAAGATTAELERHAQRRCKPCCCESSIQETRYLRGFEPRTPGRDPKVSPDESWGLLPTWLPMRVPRGLVTAGAFDISTRAMLSENFAISHFCSCASDASTCVGFALISDALIW